MSFSKNPIKNNSTAKKSNKKQYGAINSHLTSQTCTPDVSPDKMMTPKIVEENSPLKLFSQNDSSFIEDKTQVIVEGAGFDTIIKVDRKTEEKLNKREKEDSKTISIQHIDGPEEPQFKTPNPSKAPSRPK